MLVMARNEPLPHNSFQFFSSRDLKGSADLSCRHSLFPPSQSIVVELRNGKLDTVDVDNVVQIEVKLALLLPVHVFVWIISSMEWRDSNFVTSKIFDHSVWLSSESP